MSQREESKRRQPRRSAEEAAASPLKAVTFRVPADLLEAAKAEAEKRGETLSYAVAQFLRRYTR